MKVKHMLIFSGYNQRAVIAFLRVLKKYNIENYSIIAVSNEDKILNTAYCNHVAYIRKKKELNLDEMLYIVDMIANSTGADSIMIVPSTEALIRFVLDNRDMFAGRQCFMPVVQSELYYRISDKKPFIDLCLSYGLNVPETMELPEHYEKPIVAKPLRYFSSDGNVYSPILIRSDEEYDEFVRSYPTAEFFIQDLIPGKSYYLFYYISKTGLVYSFSQKNLVQQPNGKSMIASCASDLHKSRISDEYISMLKSAGFHGLIMIEVRKYKDDYYMIEANPRLWGPLQLIVDADTDIIEAFLFEYGYLNAIPKTTPNKDSCYYWSGGMLPGNYTSKARQSRMNSGLSDKSGGVEALCCADDICDWHEDGKEYFFEHLNEFESADIYKREDTMQIYEYERLKNLYMASGKHSNYQVLSGLIQPLLGSEIYPVKLRYEQERLEYISEKLEFADKRILDIGGNTGYFTFESLRLGASNVDYYEGNANHAEFVQIASRLIHSSDKVHVYPQYFMFDNAASRYDIIFNLNVIHHLGDDFGHEESMENAKKDMILKINELANHTQYMIFQMGFNWMGNIHRCLFEHGTKTELIEFISQGCKDCWEIVHVGIPEKKDGIIRYEELNEHNAARDDSLGEFLNRPLFIMRSKVSSDTCSLS